MSLRDEPLPGISDFPVRRVWQTRWADNDVFGHMNNAAYYGFFDSLINSWLAERTGVRSWHRPERCVVAESGCRYRSEVGYPDEVEVGLRVVRIGGSSVEYRLGLARAGAEGPVSAYGRWVHVYVGDDGRPIPIPDDVREALESAR